MYMYLHARTWSGYIVHRSQCKSYSDGHMLFSVYLKDYKFKTQHPKIVLLENEKKIWQLSWASFKFDCVVMYSSRNKKKLNYIIISAQSIKSPPIDFVDLYVHVYVSVAWRLKYRNTYLFDSLHCMLGTNVL